MAFDARPSVPLTDAALQQKQHRQPYRAGYGGSVRPTTKQNTSDKTRWQGDNRRAVNPLGGPPGPAPAANESGNPSALSDARNTALWTWPCKLRYGVPRVLLLAAPARSPSKLKRMEDEVQESPGLRKGGGLLGTNFPCSVSTGSARLVCVWDATWDDRI
ncbi:hypothetical protein LZ30DRAFT_713891 [Colletotrichum cereale]|nr:hypothetical protein LZ30DRAFT_713891 [Colletotrichum cereale]